MTTEEQARRFCELVGWTVREDRIVFRAELSARNPEGWLYLSQLTEGWAGVGIAVEEMRRRKFLDSHDGAGWIFVKPTPYRWTKGQGLYTDRINPNDLPAVLAAAIAALEAEAGR